jgi:hypothetical protein
MQLTANQINRLNRSYTINSATGCWEWTSTIDNNHYGVFPASGKRYRAHRAMYMHLVGPIQTGLVIDHLCRNTICVNPDHLEPVTQKENVLRGVGPAAVNAGKSHCPRGHALIDTNLIKALARKGGRACRSCDTAARKARHKGLKGAARETLIQERADKIYADAIRHGAVLELQAVAL